MEKTSWNTEMRGLTPGRYLVPVIDCDMRLKARILNPAETAVARERPCKSHVTADYRGVRSNTTIEELWEEVFSVRSAPRLYNWNPFELACIDTNTLYELSKCYLE
jgi:hypothetical protein